MDEELKKYMTHMSRGVEALNAGKGVEHDIIEEDKKRIGLTRHGRITLASAEA